LESTFLFWNGAGRKFFCSFVIAMVCDGLQVVALQSYTTVVFHFVARFSFGMCVYLESTCLFGTAQAVSSFVISQVSYYKGY
jgi:hypothetical protein